MVQETNSEFYIQKDKKRGKRLHQKNKIKKRAKEKLKQTYNPSLYTEEEINYYVDDRNIGLFAETPQRCQARCCTNPRKYGEKSLKEIKDNYNLKEGIEELNENV